MEKIWFIQIDGEEEGPYSLLDLRRHHRITPDTLVRKKDQSEWIPLRDVAELKQVFKDPEDELVAPTKPVARALENGTMAINYDPPSFLFWLMIVLAILVYAVYQLGRHA